MEEYDYPTKITAQLSGYDATPTLTFSGNLFNAAITKAYIDQAIRVGTYLQRPSDGMQVRVSSVTFSDPATYTAVVAAHGNSAALSNDGAPVEYDILFEGWTDSRDADMTRSLPRGFREVGSQIVAETYEILQTRKNTRYELVENESEHQMLALIRKLRRAEANMCISARPVYSGGYKFGNQVEESIMCGINTWPDITNDEAAHHADVYKNMGGNEIHKTQLDNTIRALRLTEFAKFKQGDWCILTDPITKAYLNNMDISYRRKGDENKVGWSVDLFDSADGKTFPIMDDDYMPAGSLLICDWNQFKRGYYANDRLNRKELATQGRYQRWLISYQMYGVVARKPRQIAKLYNMPTSLS
jgi:hypothetical protein